MVNELAPQIETNEKDLNTYLDNIDKLSMNITFDDNGNFNEEYSPIKYNIDDLYKASQDSS
ncbi:hypothetical protein IJM86_08695 [bacterium]|nr:hypothetical protein [bacterium]